MKHFQLTQLIPNVLNPWFQEEEGGVEVSEDFEGKLQDEGKGEGEDEDEEEKEEDDEDTGQEMGETGEEAECLDKQVTD